MGKSAPLAGPVMVGTGDGLVIVTENEPVVWFPAASVAVQLTCVVPMGNAKPDGGEATTVTLEQLSVAEGVKVITALQAPLSGSRTTLAMEPSTGGVLSSTVTC